MNTSPFVTRIASAALAVVCLASGCTIVTDLDRFELSEQDAGAKAGSSGSTSKAGSGGAGSSADQDAGNVEPMPSSLGCDNPRTLCLRVKNFSPHLDEIVQADLVTNADNTLRARAILDPLGVGSADADIVMPLAIPAREVPDADEESPLHLEIYADQNQDRMYTLNEDHDWNVDLPPDGKVVFPHNSDFSALDPPPRDLGADFVMHFEDMDAHVGGMLEVMVIQIVDGENDRAVGLYRLQAIPDPDFSITIPGIIDTGNITYSVEFYADLNGNRAYDDFPTDHTWISGGESGENGFELTFKHGTEFKSLPHQFVFDP